MTKIQVNEQLNKYYINKGLAKILNMVLSPYSHTCAHAHTYALTHVRTKTPCDTWQSHKAPCGAAIFIFATLARDKKFKNFLEESLKILKFISFKIQLQINPNMFHWIRN